MQSLRNRCSCDGKTLLHARQLRSLASLTTANAVRALSSGNISDIRLESVFNKRNTRTLGKRNARVKYRVSAMGMPTMGIDPAAVNLLRDPHRGTRGRKAAANKQANYRKVVQHSSPDRISTAHWSHQRLMPFDPFCRTSRTTFPPYQSQSAPSFGSRAAGFRAQLESAGHARCHLSQSCFGKGVTKLFITARSNLCITRHIQFTHRPGRPIKSLCPLIPEDRPLPDCSAVAIVFRDYLSSLIDWCRREDIVGASRAPRSFRVRLKRRDQ